MLSFHPQDRTELTEAAFAVAAQQLQLLQRVPAAHGARMLADHGRRLGELSERARHLASAVAGTLSVAQPAWQDTEAEDTLAGQWMAYLRDTAERSVLMLDLLRERAVEDVRHAAAGTPPVLIYDYEVIMDGADFERPSNYKLLRILPPEGTLIDPALRPFIIIDPRAGHGAGIGGFKPDSQVGVAFRAGHAVYFVAFGPHPHRGQTLADVMRSEAAFVREVRRRHAGSEAPVVMGNCQGGWASLLLAAANPDLTGPVVLNGAPVATWSGRVGENPMRYNGGLMGGIVPAMLLSDLNNGEFDGASIVANFEMLDPSHNYISKYYDIFRNIDSEAARERFIQFERWWGGYHFLAEEEIRWLVEQLFIGNRLARNEARLERGRQLDIKGIRSPIIVFASYGDNITPPQQALNWIADTYVDEREIKLRGQRIVYTLHEKVGHLGIFVSASVARHEHREITSTLRTVESLPPGLYEMQVTSLGGEGKDEQFEVSFAERTMADLKAIDDGDLAENAAFAAVSRFSELWSEIYELTARPLVQAVSNETTAKAMQAMQPGRVSRAMFGDGNPLMSTVPMAAEQIRATRKPVPETNLFRQAQSLWMDGWMQSIDLWRDCRDMMAEQMFFSVWSTPFMSWAGKPNRFERTRTSVEELRNAPEVIGAIERARDGGYPAALVRLMVLIADQRGAVRRDRLERADALLATDPEFRALGEERVARLIHEQSLLVEFEPQLALETLGDLLPTRADRERALNTLLGVGADIDPGTSVAAVVEAIRVRQQRAEAGQPVAAPAGMLPVSTPEAPAASGPDAGKDAPAADASAEVAANDAEPAMTTGADTETADSRPAKPKRGSGPARKG